MVETYSLLEKHEDVVTYIISDPHDRTHAHVEVGLYPWELHGASFGEMFQAGFEGREPVTETFDGVGLRIDVTPPTRHHPTPDAPLDALKDQFRMKSHGFGPNGRTYRINNASPGDLREAARTVAHHAFSYWWALDHYDDFTPGVARNESSSERKTRLDILDTIQPDGTLIYSNGGIEQAPYTLDDYTLHLAEDVETAVEQCETAFNTLIDDLLGTFPERDVKQGYRNANSDDIYTSSEETDARVQAREWKSALADVVSEADGVGRTLKHRIQREYESMDDLCDDLRTGAHRLHEMHYLGTSIEDSLIDALIETGHWTPTDA